MNVAWLFRLPVCVRTRLLRYGFNRHPAWRGTGGRVIEVTPALDRIRVALPLNRRTRNIAGSIFGGSLFAVTDGLHPLLIMLALGKDVIVWDKAASIRYRRPARRTLFADFQLQPAEILAIRTAVERDGETDFTFQVELRDGDGVLHTAVERTVYIAEKAFYQRKLLQEASP